MTHPTDEFILEQFASEKTKEQAFGLLMRKYNTDIYNSVRRIVYSHDDADDIVQNVLIKVWKYLGSFRGDSSLKTWITRICVNESLTFIDKKKKLLQLDDETYVERVLTSIPDDTHFSSDQILQIIQKGIQLLPEKQRVVFTLRYYDEMPYEEMSKVLNTSVGALKTSYHFAVKKIEEFLAKH
ncbi:MAG: RNA polymerase subunit sigma [Bacteroidetes bacterium HGW-Bacteroidetes-19]|nr:MAG: RNA polymerase subunit sigma [Bacteroidetes bacterium HGW-Bacteroidetes-19]